MVPAIAFAQQAAPKHTCRILFFNAPADAPEKLYLFDGKDAQEVELPKMNFSPLYELAPGKLTISLLPEAPADPTKIPADAPKVSVPEGVVDFYLLVSSDDTNKVAPVRMQVVDVGSDKLKLGQMLWFNLTPNTITGRVGTQRLVLKPKSRVVLDPPAKAPGEFPIRVFYQVPGNDYKHPMFSTSWGFDPRCRNVVFVNTQDGLQTPRVRAFSDFREPKRERERKQESSPE